MLHSVQQFMRRNLLSPLIDFIYPPVCFHCNRPIESDAYLCFPCRESLSPIQHGSLIHGDLRRELFSHNSPLTDCYSCYEFITGGVLQSMMHSLKYQQRTKIGIELGKLLGENIRKPFRINSSWVLIPVPLYPANERERGYNQSEYIARGVASVTGASIDTRLLLRIRKTDTQTRLEPERRKSNVSGAFGCHPGKPLPPGSSVAIIDDVITTGATIAESAKTVHSGNKKLKVYAFSVGYAHT